MIKYIHYILFVLINLSCNRNSTASLDKINVLIVDGFSNHDWHQTTLVVKSILEKTHRFSVEISTIPIESNSTKIENWKPKFANYDVIIQNTNNIQNKELRWPKEAEKNLEDYVRKGGGLYILHSANNAFPQWEEYNRMIGLGWRSKDVWPAIKVNENGSLEKIPKGEGKSTNHGPREDEVVYKLNEHPINRGFPEAWITPDTELYQYPRGPAENLTILSYAIHEESEMYWPFEWVVAYGEGRVYSSSMGHLWKGDTIPKGYQCVGFQTTLIRVTEWLATGQTFYEVPKNIPTKEKKELVAISEMLKAIKIEEGSKNQN